jgi:hypothetical protein
MHLTKEQRHNLELYVKYHSEPPTFWRLFRLNLGRYLVITVLLILLFVLAQITRTEALALVVTGLYLGVLIRDLTRFRQFVRMWPATSAVLDWERLDALLSKAD